MEANSTGGQGSRRAVKPGGGGGGSSLLCKVQERVKKVAIYLSGSLANFCETARREISEDGNFLRLRFLFWAGIGQSVQ